jgi:hypothetical protein
MATKPPSRRTPVERAAVSAGDPAIDGESGRCFLSLFIKKHFAKKESKKSSLYTLTKKL